MGDNTCSVNESSIFEEVLTKDDRQTPCRTTDGDMSIGDPPQMNDAGKNVTPNYRIQINTTDHSGIGDTLCKCKDLCARNWKPPDGYKHHTGVCKAIEWNPNEGCELHYGEMVGIDIDTATDGDKTMIDSGRQCFNMSCASGYAVGDTASSTGVTSQDFYTCEPTCGADNDSVNFEEVFVLPVNSEVGDVKLNTSCRTVANADGIEYGSHCMNPVNQADSALRLSVHNYQLTVKPDEHSGVGDTLCKCKELCRTNWKPPDDTVHTEVCKAIEWTHDGKCELHYGEMTGVTGRLGHAGRKRCFNMSCATGYALNEDTERCELIDTATPTTVAPTTATPTTAAPDHEDSHWLWWVALVMMLSGGGFLLL